MYVGEYGVRYKIVIGQSVLFHLFVFWIGRPTSRRDQYVVDLRRCTRARTYVDLRAASTSIHTQCTQTHVHVRIVYVHIMYLRPIRDPVSRSRVALTYDPMMTCHDRNKMARSGDK